MFSIKNSSGAIASVIDLTKSSCVLMVCPGDRRFTSKKTFSKVIDALKLAGFAKVSIIIGDGQLQACSMLIKSPSESLEAISIKSVQDGQQWMGEFQYITNRIPNCSVHHWDDIITKHPRYGEFFERAKSLYSTNQEFSVALNESINAYLRHVFKDSSEQVFAKESLQWQNCFEYKMREVAGLFVKAEMGLTFLAYPGNLCPGLSYALKNFIQSTNPDRLIFQEINLDSKVQKILLCSGDRIPGSLDTVHATRSVSPSLSGQVEHTATYPNTSGFFPPVMSDPIFTQVRFRLQNCRTPEEMRLMIAGLNILLATYSVSDIASPFQISANPDGSSSTSSPITDGGVTYYPSTEERKNTL